MVVEARSRQYLRQALYGSLLLISGAALAQESEHIFEPGKKHVCVPAASGQGWDCGTAEQPPAATVRREGPELRSSRANDPASTSIADAAAPEPPLTEPRDSTQQSRAVPNYLLAAPSDDASPSSETPAASAQTRSDSPAPETSPSDSSSAALSSHETPSPATSTVTTGAAAANSAGTDAANSPNVANDQKSASGTSAQSAEAAVSATTSATENTQVAAPTAAPVVESQPAATSPVEPATPPPTPAESVVATPTQRTATPGSATISDADERQQRASFTTLHANAYVLELARGSDREQVAAAASTSLPQGQTWLLRLSRDGNAWYVALWGEFPSVEAARVARDVAANRGLAEVGWPRRIGPLQQELRLQH